MTDTPDNRDTLPPHLAYLKRLVTVLAVVMIAGFLVLIYTLVTRLNAAPSALPLTLPDQIALPAGVTAEAFTQGSDWFAVVTGDDRILIYDRATGALRQEVAITR